MAARLKPSARRSLDRLESRSTPGPSAGPSQVIEEAIRRDLGLDDLAEIWAKVTPAGEEEGKDLAGDEIRAMRTERRGEGGT
ncbi:MAG: hypothetical protein JST08_00395 [Actinobacteria bacterium]|nr:hypothetical protein [Actinomycetota bacterium]